jgi:hypothetical protein
MSDGSRRKYIRKNVLITSDHDAFIQKDADDRYPERHGTTEQRRNFNPALRDGLDFWQAHYPLFLAYISSRGNSATNGNEGTQP